MTKLIFFLAAGAIGFVIDATFFFILLRGIGVSILWSRVIASCVAIFVTWLLNRSYAFRSAQAGSILSEFGKYFLASSLGASTNLLVLLVVASQDAAAYHIPAYILGTGAGLIVNYVLYNRFVFFRGV
ncbi:GtrA family protein [Xanthobacter sp. V2C-8]